MAVCYAEIRPRCQGCIYGVDVVWIRLGYGETPWESGGWFRVASGSIAWNEVRGACFGKQVFLSRIEASVSPLSERLMARAGWRSGSLVKSRVVAEGTRCVQREPNFRTSLDLQHTGLV